MSSSKIAQLRQQFDKWKVDAVLIGSSLNRRWLTGFTGSFGYVLVTRDHALLATDGRYWARVGQEAPDFELYKYVRKADALKEFLNSAEINTLAIEANHLTLNEYNGLRKAANCTLKPIAVTVEQLRMAKTSAEVEKIRAAAAITDYAMAQVNEIAKVGMSERTLAWELEKLMRERGADKMAFDIIVAAGENGASPHHTPSDRPLQLGDAITIDMGANRASYNSDLTRAFHMGSDPSAKFWEIYNLVLAAHTAAVNHLKIGMTSKEADTIARDVIAAGGYADDFKHSLGHGVGLEIHELPTLSQRSEAIIPANSIITIEPGIYIDGWSGIRIEDLGIMTENGVELISKCPKNPIITV